MTFTPDVGSDDRRAARLADSHQFSDRAMGYPVRRNRSGGGPPHLLITPSHIEFQV